MDIDTRIRRRERRGGNHRLILEYQALNPVAHIEEPPGRGPVLERVLDYLDPVFDGRFPADAALWGPPGSGKSAVITALFQRLSGPVFRPQAGIQTTTRAQTVETPSFVHVDTRAAASEFQLYHETLSALTDESVPEHGVSTEDLLSRLRSQLAEQGAIVAVDHVGEPRTMTAETVRELFEPFDHLVSLLTIGRSPPEGDWPTTVIEIPAYGQQVLIDILMTRGSSGLAANAFSHSQARTLAAWASGNAHDALAALFGAAVVANREGRERLSTQDLERGMDAVPQPSASLGWVLTLPENRQLVLRELLNLSETDRQSVTATTEALADRPTIDLSPGTIRRFLYELAEDGIVERIQAERSDRQGRPPSRLEPRFPTLVFEQLYDMQG